MNHRSKASWAVFFFSALLWAAPGWAHNVSIFAWVENDTIQTQSKFSGGRYVSGGQIEVYSQEGDKLLEGHTDERGRFSFPVPRLRSDLKIVLTAGSGHGNQWVVRAAEFAVAGLDSPPPSQTAPPIATRAAGEPASAPCLDQDRLETLIRAQLEQQLAPLRAEVAEQAWGLRDIVSGIGYILGLVGLAGYFRGRKLSHADGKPQP